MTALCTEMLISENLKDSENWKIHAHLENSENTSVRGGLLENHSYV